MRPRLSLQHGRLTGTMEGRKNTFELVPTGKPHEFWFEWHNENGPFDEELASPVVFVLDRRGRATGYRMKGIEQALWMRAVRVGD